MTQPGVGYPARLPLGGRRSSEFLPTREGQWLLPLDIAANCLAVVREHVLQVARLDPTISLGAEAVVGAELIDGYGCWQPGQQLGQDEHVQAVRIIAEQDRGRQILNPNDATTQAGLRVCDTRDCLFPRHYDFTYSNGQRNQLLVPDKDFFVDTEGSTGVTIWGPGLPTVEESVEEFRKLQKKCPPFEDEKTSPLTAHGISQVTIESRTGCWPVRTYYNKHAAFWSEKDGYGRLTLRRHIAGDKKPRGAQQMAHRVIFQVTGHDLEEGKELNHLCCYRSCANPAHLDQVNRRQHLEYGRLARWAIL